MRLQDKILDWIMDSFLYRDYRTGISRHPSSAVLVGNILYRRIGVRKEKWEHMIR